MRDPYINEVELYWATITQDSGVYCGLKHLIVDGKIYHLPPCWNTEGAWACQLINCPLEETCEIKEVS